MDKGWVGVNIREAQIYIKKHLNKYTLLGGGGRFSTVF